MLVLPVPPLPLTTTSSRTSFLAAELQQSPRADRPRFAVLAGRGLARV